MYLLNTSAGCFLPFILKFAILPFNRKIAIAHPFYQLSAHLPIVVNLVFGIIPIDGNFDYQTSRLIVRCNFHFNLRFSSYRCLWCAGMKH